MVKVIAGKAIWKEYVGVQNYVKKKKGISEKARPLINRKQDEIGGE